MNELALFAGAGGGLLAAKQLGHTIVCAVEKDEYAREVLLRRQRDGWLDRFPIWDDVTTFDGTKWRGKVDVISGGFPCQDISAAGCNNGVGFVATVMNRSQYTKCSLCGKITVHSYTRNGAIVRTCLSRGCAYFVTEPVKTKGRRNGVR